MTSDGRNDFDFYVGQWEIRNRRLVERLAGCTEWEEFPGVSVARSILGGIGNFDETSFHRAGGSFHGVTLRLFDPSTCEWSLYWSDSATGKLFTPMIGKFVDRVGTFYALDEHNGRKVFSRFIWSGVSATTAHWAQAFSDDGGANWETNWTMASTRVS